MNFKLKLSIVLRTLKLTNTSVRRYKDKFQTATQETIEANNWQALNHSYVSIHNRFPAFFFKEIGVMYIILVDFQYEIITAKNIGGRTAKSI